MLGARTYDRPSYRPRSARTFDPSKGMRPPSAKQLNTQPAANDPSIAVRGLISSSTLHARTPRPPAATYGRVASRRAREQAQAKMPTSPLQGWAGPQPEPEVSDGNASIFLSATKGNTAALVSASEAPALEPEPEPAPQPAPESGLLMELGPKLQPKPDLEPGLDPEPEPEPEPESEPHSPSSETLGPQQGETTGGGSCSGASVRGGAFGPFMMQRLGSAGVAAQRPPQQASSGAATAAQRRALGALSKCSPSMRLAARELESVSR